MDNHAVGSTYENGIIGIGLGGFGVELGTPVVSLSLSGPAAVIIGPNGSGKTRLITDIGFGADLILNSISAADDLHRFCSIDMDPYWLTKSIEEPEDGRSGMVRQPFELYEIAKRNIARILSRERQLFSKSPEGFSNICSRLERLTDRQLNSVALVWASFNFSDLERHPDTEAYLLGAVLDILEDGFIGVGSRSTNREARVRIWNRRNRDAKPFLAEMEALLAVDHESLSADAIPLSWMDKGSLDLGFKLDGPLSPLTGDSLTGLTGPGLGWSTTSEFQVSTMTMPIVAWTLSGGLFSEWEETDLILEGMECSLGSQQRFIEQMHDENWGLRSYAAGKETDLVPIDVTEDGDVFIKAHSWLQPNGAISEVQSFFLPKITDFALHFVGTVNRFLAEIVPLGVRLFLVDDRGVFRWRAQRRDERGLADLVVLAIKTPLPGVSLDQLSLAERRWARFAIRFCDRFLDRVIDFLGTEGQKAWAASELVVRPAGLDRQIQGNVLLIDEPETGLHRSAEPVLASSLANLYSWSGVKVIVATHSPSFVREFTNVGGHVYWTTQDLHGFPVVTEHDFSDIESVGAAIGLDPVSMMQLVRTFVCVEGIHDKVILEELFGEYLVRHGIYVVALRGAKGLAQVAEMNVLWNMSDARFIVILDGIEPTRILEIVSEAREAFLERGATGAMPVLWRLDSSDTGPHTERTALRELLFEAVRSDRLHRIAADGLPERDVLSYLHPLDIVAFPDPSALVEVEKEELWRQLVQDWRRDSRSPRLDFKKWLVATYPGTNFDEDTLRRAARRLNPLPPDLKGLLARLIDSAL